MRSRWRGLNRLEKSLLAGMCVLAIGPFLLLGRATVALGVSVAVYLVLLPVLAGGLLTLYAELGLRRRVVCRRVQRAVTRGELVLHYQPQIGLLRGNVVAVEALVRWNHPRDGLVPPGAFLPALQDTALAKELDLHVLDLALAQAAAWRAEGRPLGVGVNMAPTWLLDPRLPDELERALNEHGLAAGALELEITELAFEDGRPFQRGLERVKEIGVGLALDDFGIGHSSLARLVQLPVDRLKIDRSFVAAMPMDRRAASVVRATIDVAHELDVLVVAEGVEQQVELRQLEALGCDLAQGFLFSPAVPAEALAERVEMLGRLTGVSNGRRRAL